MPRQLSSHAWGMLRFFHDFSGTKTIVDLAANLSITASELASLDTLMEQKLVRPLPGTRSYELTLAGQIVIEEHIHRSNFHADR